eukprot:CAMPEP_0177762140 /NCGR_PEP_ID=MMETSP0491_2-20121128/6182_1 /TAXON_ID=63592 /ORGANISM="Tetraselmis chuii, Strain PLY429" /LENGTH=158 /DNA_ID=CAMNT_0019278167 /DNA_START=69 /DNA_END=545 /DNA_ORIENTATION=+
MVSEGAVAGVSSTDLVLALEDFFSGAEFTTAVGDFMSANVAELEFKDLDGEQPLKNYDLFKKYNSMIESLLGKFLEENKLEVGAVYEACKQGRESGDATANVCIDYLLACTEYESFMELAYDHQQLSSYVPASSLTEMWGAEEEAAAHPNEDSNGIPA